MFVQFWFTLYGGSKTSSYCLCLCPSIKRQSHFTLYLSELPLMGSFKGSCPLLGEKLKYLRWLLILAWGSFLKALPHHHGEEGSQYSSSLSPGWCLRIRVVGQRQHRRWSTWAGWRWMPCWSTWWSGRPRRRRRWRPWTPHWCVVAAWFPSLPLTSNLTTATSYKNRRIQSFLMHNI